MCIHRTSNSIVLTSKANVDINMDDLEYSISFADIEYEALLYDFYRKYKYYEDLKSNILTIMSVFIIYYMMYILWKNDYHAFA